MHEVFMPHVVIHTSSYMEVFPVQEKQSLKQTKGSDFNSQLEKEYLLEASLLIVQSSVCLIWVEAFTYHVSSCLVQCLPGQGHAMLFIIPEFW